MAKIFYYFLSMYIAYAMYILLLLKQIDHIDFACQSRVNIFLSNLNLMHLLIVIIICDHICMEIRVLIVIHIYLPLIVINLLANDYHFVCVIEYKYT